MIYTLDLETSILHKGNPYVPTNFIVTTHVLNPSGVACCRFWDDPLFLTQAREATQQATLLVGFNLKFDLAWLKRHDIECREGIRIWDCQIAEFILSGQTNPFPSLDDCAALYNLPLKKNVVAEYWDKGISTENIPREIVEEYGNHDIWLTHEVYQKQVTDPRMTPELHKLILLAGLDMLVLMDMEFNGVVYNTEGSLEEAAKLTEELNAINLELNTLAGTACNWDSGDQLSCFLFGGAFTSTVTEPVTKVYKTGPRAGQEYVRNEFVRTDVHTFEGLFKPIKGTELKKSNEQSKLYSTAEDVLLQLKGKSKVQQRVLFLLSRRSTIAKLVGTYLQALPDLLQEMNWGNVIHGSFNQCIARTGRLSSSKPNMQNAPEDVDLFMVSRYD